MDLGNPGSILLIGSRKRLIFRQGRSMIGHCNEEFGEDSMSKAMFPVCRAWEAVARVKYGEEEL